ncbi:MAG: ribonuclease H-like domain-containing protein [Anaerolineae bacterium]|nr:ribonuclease H-like domain-containing protein [Anaerolineae bacterium]
MSDEPPSSRRPADNVAERLRRLQHLGVQRGVAGLKSPPPKAAPPATPPQQAHDHRGNWTGVGDRPHSSPAPGQEVLTPYGPCLVVEAAYPLSTVRGGVSLDALLRISGQAVAACAHGADPAGFELRRAAFLDTETTGLSGGAGTLAFMVGIGAFEPTAGEASAFVVRQVFMRSPAEERALLHVVAELLGRCAGLVSFNGRAFDAPLLATRFALNRLPSSLHGLPHLDLLPLARQRWRWRLPSCAMSALERDILAFRRSQEDVPGWLIPSLYRDYAATGNFDVVAPVFYHNREDVLSMAPLAAILCAPFDGGADAEILFPSHPADGVSLGRAYEELGWLARSEAAYRRALASSLAPELRRAALSRLGDLLKRQGRHAEAAEVWLEWITSVSGPDLTPYVELAKHAEWREGDLAAARKWTLWALHLAQGQPAGPDREQVLAELRHRLARIEAKLAGRRPEATGDASRADPSS